MAKHEVCRLLSLLPTKSRLHLLGLCSGEGAVTSRSSTPPSPSEPGTCEKQHAHTCTTLQLLALTVQVQRVQEKTRRTNVRQKMRRLPSSII